MSGALAERVFAHKIEKTGFVGLTIVDRRSFGIDDAAGYPLFTPDLLDLMRELVPAPRQPAVATAITLTGRKPTTRPGEPP